MNYLALIRANALCCCLLLTVVGTGLAQAPATATRPAAAATYSVQARTRGILVDIFFTAGDWVKRGQILAKLELPDGSPTYLIAPAAGRISPARQYLGETISAHTVLTVIETPHPH